MYAKISIKRLILTPDKVDFKTKSFISDKEEHLIMRKMSILQEDITVINLYAPKSEDKM